VATLKQQAVIKDLLENTGKPVSQAMAEAGYAPTTAKNPQQLTNSKAWEELMEKHLPDDKLLTKHEEALEATKWNDFTGEREPDHSTRLKGIDMGYKLKGKYKDAIIQFNADKMDIEFIKNEGQTTPGPV